MVWYLSQTVGGYFDIYVGVDECPHLFPGVTVCEDSLLKMTTWSVLVAMFVVY